MSRAVADSKEERRLAIFLPSLVGGGAERAMLNLARGFRDLGHTVELIAGSALGPYRAEVPDGVRLVDLEAPRVLRALPALARHLRRSRPARLYAAMEHANLVALWARRLAGAPDLRVVVSIRDTFSAHLPAELQIRQRAILPLARLFYRQADGIVAVSAGAAEDAARVLGIERGRIAVVPNPVLTAELPRLMAEPVEHPWLSGNGERPPVVLGCGRLVAQKDLATLLRAFALLRRQHRPARLLILGEGPERPALAALAAELGIAADLDLAGFAPNPFNYMARAAVLALSSIREGSPNVLVQALACGCPVVSTDCPSGPREILAGLPPAQARLVPVGDPPAMAAALQAVLASPRLPAPSLAEFDYLTAARRYLEVGKA